MTISEQSQRSINAFFAAVDPAHRDNENLSFSYIALKQENVFHIIQGAIFFHAGESKIATTHFKSANVRAGNYSLPEIGLNGKNLVNSLISGFITTPDGELHFPGNESGQYSTTYDPFHADGLKSQARFNLLTICGASREAQPHTMSLDWELRASPTPFESLQELAFEYKLGFLKDVCSIEIYAFHVSAFDFSSVVQGTTARLGVFLMHGASPDDVTVGYRILTQNRVEVRASTSGKLMEWENRPEHQYGIAEISVPQAAVIQCFVSYLGVAQHFGWASDPRVAQNARRAVYNTFDEGLIILKEFLTKSGAKGRNARDLESATAWLLWMLGFSVAHLGGTDRTQDAADIIATTPKGDFVIVECTTGLLIADNKLPLLIYRAERVRSSVIASNNNHLRVLPVIVTTRTRAEVSANQEQAERLGVLVLTRENLEQAANFRTLLLPNAEQIYEEGVQAVDVARAKYESHSTLPL
jgi:hypothetical protein